MESNAAAWEIIKNPQGYGNIFVGQVFSWCERILLDIFSDPAEIETDIELSMLCFETNTMIHKGAPISFRWFGSEKNL